ncbi:MAG: CocE/NonD family hydrolase [Actinomycetota bacterium]|nr:CocE/NonD family hydrolase [Actinomycetota bacterium]
MPMIVRRDLPVPMDDGLVLRADVFRPDGPGRFPVIMSLGPYGKALPFSREWFAARWERLLAGHPEITDGSSCAQMNWETVDPEQWVPHGYAVVRVDSRGAGRSPGLLDLLSAREIRDFHLAIEWAGTRSWSTGRVGLCGVSYYAINQWLVAATRPPHLAAILPWEGASDHYRDMCYHGGILSDGFFERWYPRQVLPMQHGRGTAGPRSPWVSDGLAAGPETRPEAELRQLRTSYLDDIRGHRLDDGWHAERSADLGQIEVPLLSAANWGGLGLHSRGNFEGFTRAGSAAKWLEVHTGRHEELFYTAHGLGLQRRFFDHFLQGADNGWDAEPPVQLSIRHADGTIARRGEQAWPLPGTAWTRWYLEAGAAALLGSAAPGSGAPGSAAPGSGAPGSPPQTAASTAFDGRGDGVTFTSAPLPAPLELTGPLRADLHVSTDSDDADLFLTLRAFAPGGQEVTFAGANDPRAPLSQGWLRLSHRAVDPARSLPWRPWHPHQAAEPARPGQAYPVAIELWPTCVVLPAGFRLALSVAGRDFARPEGTGDFHGSGPFAHHDPADRPPARTCGITRVHTGARTPSSVLLPVIG